MTLAQQQKIFAAIDCEVAFDNLTRQLYATDASIYQIKPRAVAFPRNAFQASAVIRAAADAGLAITPRGAGTGLVGGAIGDGLIVEFSRFNRQITELNLERKTVRVGAGVVLDQLNSFLQPHGFRFGPDVATSSRATLGGMIGNNSSGSHTAVYGTTADHLRSLEVILADGRIETVGREHDTLRPQQRLTRQLVNTHANEITRRMPPGLLKRWPGYGLDRFLRRPGDLNDILCGSEGTLAAMTSAELNIVPLPAQKGLGLIFFGSVSEAMQATVELLSLKPAAIEHIDRVLFDQTRGQFPFKAARDLLELDAKPCESILIVEFFEDVEDGLAAFTRRKLGLRKTILKTNAEMNLVWSLRKAGLSLLTGCKGDAKPVTGVEDTAVRPERLPEYVASLESLMKSLGLQACYYGHAASGLLHVRPVLDLHKPGDLKKFRQVTNEVSAIVRQFNGSLAAEHGVGIARTEFMPEQLGEDLLGALRKIKASFDPRNCFNPGRIIPDGQFKIDRNFRMGADYELKLPFDPVLAFAAKDGSFVRNLEQCNGCGGCRKDTPVMCPTFIATGEEIMSTRGRANAIRAALDKRAGNGNDPLASLEMETALSNCLACKACTSECPSNVNLALLKAELIHARHQRDGLPLRERLLGAVDFLGRLGCWVPGLANASLTSPLLRRLLSAVLGISDKRPLPLYAKERFDHWFARRAHAKFSHRRQVILWDDTFVRYHEPRIGKAAVAVLEAAGFEVLLATSRRCCGRPAFSQGNLDEAARLGQHNLELLNELVLRDPSARLVFLEPSCYSMFAEDYRELGLPGAEEISKRSFLFEQFIDELTSREPGAIRFKPRVESLAIHAHCHAKSLTNLNYMSRLAQRLPGRNAKLLETGCCGMAGAFGALESRYELSLKVAQPLIEKLHQQPEGTIVIASGTSCRHQIEHLTSFRPRHMAEVIADALAPK